MPIYELHCDPCNITFETILSVRKLDGLKIACTKGDITCDECEGNIYLARSLVSVHSAPSGYPFTTEPWLLPPVQNQEGKWVPQQVEVQNRSDYKNLLKKHGLVENLTPAEMQTMYGEKKVDKNHVSKEDIAEDMNVFHEMKTNHRLRRKILSQTFKKSMEAKNVGV